ncbi:hypothetical protein JXQ70_13310 [bacterium]|nr:hypothetical protein [bacterium]
MNKRVAVIVMSVLLCVIWSGATVLAGDQESVKKYTIGTIQVIHSDILGEDRPFFVSTPFGYEQSQAHYPVMYVLDGETHFQHASGTVRFLSQNGLIPQMIVVAVPNTARYRDFTPVKDQKLEQSGGGEKFLAFMRDELIPQINKNYRTAPFQILVGHSLCGMYAFYTLITAPDLFDGYIAIAPYLAFNDGYLLKELETALTKQASLDKFIYITVGNEQDELDKIEACRTILKKSAAQDLIWDIAQFEDEIHLSIPLISIYHGLRFIYDGWALSKQTFDLGFSGLETHYQKLSQRYGYQITPPEEVINIFGYTLLQKKEDSAGAIAAFQKNVELYPDSANVYDSLGEGYEQTGQYELALKNYTIAVDKAKELKDPNLKVFEEHIKRVSSKIK